MAGALAMNDFGRFYYSSQLHLNGEDMYGPSPATEISLGEERRQLWNMNPPHFHLMVLPLALLPPIQALAGWIVMNLIALLVAARIVVRELVLRITLSRVLWALLGFLCCSATCAIVATGQVTFVLMLPMTLAWRAGRRGHWIAAGAWLGVLAGVKPFLGIFGAYLLISRRYRAVGAMIAAMTLSVAVGAFVFGIASYGSWIRVVADVHWTFVPMNASVTGLATRLLAANPQFAPIVDLPHLATWIAVLGSLTLVVVGLVLSISGRSEDAVDRAFGLLILTSLLASPLGWIYYLWLVLGPVLALSRRPSPRLSRIQGIALAVALPGAILPLVFTTVAQPSVLASMVLGSAYGWTLLALWCAIAIDRPLVTSPQYPHQTR